MTSNDPADNGQRVAEYDPNAQENDDRGPGEGSSGLVAPEDGVVQGPDDHHRTGEESRCHIGMGHPTSSSKFGILGS